MAPRETQPDESLLTLQLRVARRADELARARVAPTGLNLHCWLLAEREVLNGKLTDWTEQPGAVASSTPARASHHVA